MDRLFPLGALVALLAMAFLLPEAAVTPPPLAAAGDACRGIGPNAEPLPPSLLGAFLRAFHLHAPEAARGAVVRCAGGRLMACGIGANLPCGLADTRTHMPAADKWCAQHENAPFIPFYVTGHASLYGWRCDGAEAAIIRQVAHADAQGYVSEYWRPLAP